MERDRDTKYVFIIQYVPILQHGEYDHVKWTCKSWMLKCRKILWHYGHKMFMVFFFFFTMVKMWKWGIICAIVSILEISLLLWLVVYVVYLRGSAIVHINPFRPHVHDNGLWYVWGIFFSFNPLTVGASSKYYLRLKIMILNKNYNWE